MVSKQNKCPRRPEVCTTPYADSTVPEERGSHLRDEDGVDAAQLGVDLEAEVGEHLGRRSRHVLGLDALGRDAQHAVPHPLHLKVNFSLATAEKGRQKRE